MMYWLRWGKWSYAGGERLVWQRIYLFGYYWTPLCRIARRSKDVHADWLLNIMAANEAYYRHCRNVLGRPTGDTI